MKSGLKTEGLNEKACAASFTECKDGAIWLQRWPKTLPMKIPILIRIRIAQTYETRIVKYTEMGGRTRRVQDPHRSGQLTRFSVRIFTAFGRPFLIFLFVCPFFKFTNVSINLHTSLRKLRTPFCPFR